jgi:uncharacterized SAM-binding protein YcdF (DUF218 family)
LRVRLVVLLAVVVAAALWLPSAGTALIRDDGPTPADAIVVLAGNAPNRLPRGLELQRQGYARLMIVSNEEVHTHGLETTWLALHEAGLAAPELADADLVVLDNPPPESTIDEARRVAGILTSRGLRSVLLVTDAFHSRRAWLLFHAVFERHGLSVRSTPTTDSYDLAHWWAHPVSARRTVEEWTKLGWYAVQGALW